MKTIIKIDWDHRGRPDVGPFCLVLSALRLTPFYMKVTPSRRHWHIQIETPQTLTPAQIVGLQLFLGSDPHREFYNLFRITRKGAPKYWRDRWNVFFKKEGVK